jgi:hypothetical protein
MLRAGCLRSVNTPRSPSSSSRAVTGPASMAGSKRLRVGAVGGSGGSESARGPSSVAAPPPLEVRPPFPARMGRKKGNEAGSGCRGGSATPPRCNLVTAFSFATLATRMRLPAPAAHKDAAAFASGTRNGASRVPASDASFRRRCGPKVLLSPAQLRSCPSTASPPAGSTPPSDALHSLGLGGVRTGGYPKAAPIPGALKQGRDPKQPVTRCTRAPSSAAPPLTSTEHPTPMICVPDILVTLLQALWDGSGPATGTSCGLRLAWRSRPCRT